MGKILHKCVADIVFKDLRRIHWRKYITRKVIILGVFGIVGYYIEHAFHVWYAGKGGEIAIGTVIEHILFEVPVEEV